MKYSLDVLAFLVFSTVNVKNSFCGWVSPSKRLLFDTFPGLFAKRGRCKKVNMFYLVGGMILLHVCVCFLLLNIF